MRSGRPRFRTSTWVIGSVLLVAVAVIVVSGVIPKPSALMGDNSGSAGSVGTSTSTPDARVDGDAPTDSETVVAPSEPAQVALSPAAISTTIAAVLLATIPVKPASSTTAYNRTADFGEAWLDENHNGCDTRNDILNRDLTNLTKAGACRVLTGVLVSPYTGSTIDFVRGAKTSALVQIDHLVALGDAWETGAENLSQAQRETLANDPLELMAVDGRSNDQKGDKDAAEWLPTNAAFDCTYVARQISVKVTYSLWVTPTEHAAMAAVLSRCGNITGTASQFAAAVDSTPTTVVPVTVVPAPPQPPAGAVPTVHPGAFCAKADAGQHGRTSSGTSMVCETSPTDSRLRWRAG